MSSHRQMHFQRLFIATKVWAEDSSHTWHSKNSKMVATFGNRSCKWSMTPNTSDGKSVSHCTHSTNTAILLVVVVATIDCCAIALLWPHPMVQLGYTPWFGIYASYTTLGLGGVNRANTFTSVCNLYLLNKVGMAVPKSKVGMIDQRQRSSLLFTHPFIKVVWVGKISSTKDIPTLSGFFY